MPLFVARSVPVPNATTVGVENIGSAVWQRFWLAALRWSERNAVSNNFPSTRNPNEYSPLPLAGEGLGERVVDLATTLSPDPSPTSGRGENHGRS